VGLIAILGISGVLGIGFILILSIGRKKNGRNEKQKYKDLKLRLLSVNNFKSDDYFAVKYFDFHSTTMVTGVSWVSEIWSNWSNTWGGKSDTLVNESEYAKKEAIKLFKIQVLQRYPECNCVLNVKVDIMPISWRQGLMLMVNVTGNPVIAISDGVSVNSEE
jgi:hypothetical protein